MGICGYYRIFIKGFSKKCALLYRLTRDDVDFEWAEAEEASFEILKEAFATAPILSHPNFDLAFIIETDASDQGLGGVLMQQYNGRNRIQHISRTLQPGEKKLR